MRRRLFLAAPVALVGCSAADKAALTAIGEDAGFLNADGSVSYWGIVLGTAQIALAVLSLADPPAATVLSTAIKIGVDLEAAVKAGSATPAQLQTHATTVLLAAAPHITVVGNKT